MILKNKLGVSILEVLIASAIMVVVMAGFSSMMLNQNKEIRALTETLGAQDLQKSLVASLAKGDVCQYVLKPQQFDADAVKNGIPQEIDLGASPIYSAMIDPATPGSVLIKKGDTASVFSPS